MPVGSSLRSARRAGVAAALAMLLATALAAQTPAARIGHAMATAGPEGGVYVFGGNVAGFGPRLVDSLWRWDGSAWHALAGAGPSSRTMTAMTYDTRRSVLVLFGGTGPGNGTLYGDTWEFDGTRWTERNVRTPGPRDHHAMVYDEARGVVVMFGGRPLDNVGPFPRDTWTWDGAVWRRVDSTSGPPGLGHHAMAYDRDRQRVVLFGGSGDGGTTSGDVWEWDGTSWHRSQGISGPGARTRHRMVYDAARHLVVLYGGQIGQGPGSTATMDTWGWDGRAWTRLATDGPPVRYVHAMAWDAKRQRIIAFGGGRAITPYGLLGDLWEWDGVRWQERAAR